MKFDVERVALKDGLANVMKAVGRRTQDSALAVWHVRIEARAEGVLEICGTNRELTLWAEVPAEVAEPGVVLLPAERLAAAASRNSAEVMRFVEHGEQVKVTAGSSRFTAQTIPAEEFPEVAHDDAVEWIPINGPAVFGALKRVAWAVSKEPSRYTITGVLFDAKKNKLTLAATNGKCLGTARLTVPCKAAGRYIVPDAAVPSVLAFCDVGGDDQVELALAEKRIEMRRPGRRMSCLLLDGTYPDYASVIPKDAPHAWTVKRAEFMDALNESIVFSVANDCGGYSVDIRISGGRMTLAGRNGEVGSAEVCLPAECDLQESAQAIDATLLMGAAAGITGTDFTLRFSDERSAMFCAQDGYTAVVMPMRAKT